jgi:FtsP/CotA-like multicopper oxidase with cupredoxin domain
MMTRTIKRIQQLALCLLALVWVLGGTAFADPVAVTLEVEKVNATMPDATIIPMWGFRESTDTTDPGVWRIPTITATAGDDLTITLNNNLSVPGLVEPTSIMIPGQKATEGGAMTPTWTDGSTGLRGLDLTKRVRSLTHEAGAGGSATYQWASLKAGTYLIQSATHMAVQMQMGLYAILKVDAVGPVPGPVEAYPGITYDNEVTLLFSEIDPVLHTAVTVDDYGPGKGMTSTIEYHPKYFLINGQPYSIGAEAISAGNPGENILLRLLNAGLKTRVPVLQGAYLTMLAEDGNLYPFTSREQYSVELGAGKTIDTMISSAPAGSLAVYDRRLALSNAGASPGGMFAILAVNPGGAVLAPNGGEAVNAGDNTTISWVSNPAADNYDVRLSYNGTNFWNLATGVAGTSYAWTVPNNNVSTAVVRVVARNGAIWVGSDDSDAPFTIIKGGTVLSPNGGENLAGNSIQSVQWTAHPTATTYDVRLSFNEGTSFWTIASGLTGTGYVWTVPNNNVANGMIRIVARNAGAWIGADDSDGTFTITKQ